MISLSKAASKASFWNISSNIANGMVRFLVTAILAHFLSPSEFGVVGIALIVVGVVAVFGNTGLGAALIYKKDSDDTYYSTVYWINLCAGIAMSLITVALAYPVSLFFNERTVFYIMPVLSVNFTVSMLSSIHFIKLQKKVDYKTIGFAEIVSNLIAGTAAVILAYCGAGVWSIVIQNVLMIVIKTCLFWIAVRWVPGLIFDFKKFLELFRYSRNILLEAIFNYFSQNIDYFIIGKSLGVKGLGYYKLAYSLVHIPYENFSKKLTSVLFPLLCNVKDEPKRYRRGYLNAIKFNSMAVFPVMASFFFIAGYFIPVVYGSKWVFIVPTAKILAIAGMIRCVNTFSGTIFNSQGRPDIGLKFNLGMFPFIFAALLIGARFGINGIATAMLFTVIVSSIILHYILVTKFKVISFADIAVSLLPAVINSIILFVILCFLSKITDLGTNVLNLIFYMAVSAGLIFMIYFIGFKKDLNELAGFVSSMFRK